MKISETISLQQALQAQKALRDAAGLEEERFPIAEFVGMISDEIEQLRRQGKTDEEIAAVIEEGSAVKVTAQEISAHYASPERRHGSHE